MKPKFKTVADWEKAQILLQPAMIRVVDNLRNATEKATGWKSEFVDTTVPIPGHQLELTRRDHKVVLKLWELCFQICFLNYSLSTETEITHRETQEVDIDDQLFEESGEVDWQRLETKTQYYIGQFFNNLSSD